MTTNAPPVSAGAQTDTLRAAARRANDALGTAGLTWMDYADGVGKGRLLRDLLDVHQVPEDEARAVLGGLAESLSEAARHLTMAAVRLDGVEKDIDNLIESVNRARKGNGLPALPALKTGM